MVERVAEYATHCRNLWREAGVEDKFFRVNLRALSAGLPERVKLPEKYRETGRELLAMLAKPQTLAICGGVGLGKTHLACGLIRAFCGCGRSAFYRRTRQFLDEVTSAPWEQKDKIRAKYLRVDLLVLDEIQVRDEGKEWQDNEITTLIDQRYARNVWTLILSNLKAPELFTNLGKSVWRRIVETGGQPIEADWPRIMTVLAPPHSVAS